MRILIATSDYPPALGGMSEYSAAWARELRALGCDVEVRVRDWKPGPLRDPWGAYRALAETKADIVMAHTWIGWGPALCYQKKRPYVLSAHGAEIVGPAQSRYYRFLLRQSCKGANRVFAVSSYTAGHVAALGVSRERISVIGNGVDVERFTPHSSRKSSNVILTVGSLVARKGHEIVIEAMALLREKRPQLRYVIAGGWTLNSSSEKFLRELVIQRKLSDRVNFLGFVKPSDLPELYRKADLFVMTGREVKEKGWVEGFGISYLEAAASGLPIIATDTGGVREAVTSENALIVPTDDPRATADAIINLLDDVERRSRMSRAGIEWAHANTWRIKAEEGLEIMKQITHV